MALADARSAGTARSAPGRPAESGRGPAGRACCPGEQRVLSGQSRTAVARRRWTPREGRSGRALAMCRQTDRPMHGTCCSASSLCEKMCSIRPHHPIALHLAASILFSDREENCALASGNRCPLFCPNVWWKRTGCSLGRKPLPVLMGKGWRKRTRCGSTG